ncbi:hypothetical protein [Shinella zoogloeoides]|uniref:hypothetical protein n=1 Tax=Shinella zoogloeoides TaxID=352475 RepID=UPI001F574E8A|nr:hypothetical protein [Shinella zoogloeoides]
MTSSSSQRAKALAGEGENLPARMIYADHERDAVRVQKSRLAARARYGSEWDGKVANDNIAWPLATALVREGNTELLKAAMYYRKIHDTAKSEAKLGGSGVQLNDGMSIDRHSVLKADGKIAYRRVRQSTAAEADIPARRRFDASTAEDGDEPQKNWSSIPRPWKGDEPVNAMIDAQSRLFDLRNRLGVLAEAFEMATIDGATYEAIGNMMGNAHKVPATAAGRSIVHMGLITIRDAIGKVSRADLAS